MRRSTVGRGRRSRAEIRCGALPLDGRPEDQAIAFGIFDEQELNRRIARHHEPKPVPHALTPHGLFGCDIDATTCIGIKVTE